MDDFYYMWPDEDFDYDQNTYKEGVQLRGETPDLSQDNNNRINVTSERYHDVLSLKLSKEKNDIIDACEEGELLDYYSSQQTKEYPDELNATAKGKDIELVGKMASKPKNYTIMKLIVLEPLDFTNKVEIQEQHNVDQPLETLVIKVELVEECLLIQEFLGQNRKELIDLVDKIELISLCMPLDLNHEP
ncbi:hypothetical protein J1N35_016427 [Gossypium stocksii]|uniref:Uncharacterized protein n=1 Tax=Gossypium stocksii TaxID=47602 RepID=A0A9D4A560_9ROSI|nr:hypothetical protein J1N35_016427 [Gossypium stocksii]